MTRNIKKYTNPFLKAKGPTVAPANSALSSLQEALALHQQGRLSQAEAIYRQLLVADPKHVHALHLLGVVAHQTGNYQGAVDMIGMAIEINPRVASFHANLALALEALKQLEAAVASYDKALCSSLTPLRPISTEEMH